MDRLDAMRLFTRIVERRSFSLAAQDFGLPRSSASETVKQLEARLGVRLLQRTTRQVGPTLDGEAFYRRCLAILADIEEAEGAFTGARPKGLLRVEVQGTLARHFMLPGLARFLAAYPELSLHIGEGDRLVDAIREGADCVLRAGIPQDSAMIGRKITDLAQATLASPDYLARHGVPSHPDALDGHRMVGFVSSATGALLPMDFRIAGARREVMLPATVTVTGAETMAAAARQGLGLIQVPRYRLEADLASGILVEILADYPPDPLPVHVLYPHSRQLSPRVRVFIDWLVGEFGRRMV
jgi:DNA-binding transcriptional LysR family regulator